MVVHVRHLQYAHHQREQAEVTADDEEEGEIARADALLHTRCEDEIAEEGDEGRRHHVPAAITRAVLRNTKRMTGHSLAQWCGKKTHGVPSLEDDKEPAGDVGRDRHALCVDAAEA